MNKSPAYEDVFHVVSQSKRGKMRLIERTGEDWEAPRNGVHPRDAAPMIGQTGAAQGLV